MYLLLFFLHMKKKKKKKKKKRERKGKTRETEGGRNLGANMADGAVKFLLDKLTTILLQQVSLLVLGDAHD
jgi:hypothetical protein